MGSNVDWVLRTIELKARMVDLNETRLFLPVQCYSIRQFERFYKLIEGRFFDGLSMPVRNMGVNNILLFLIRMYQLEIKQVHLLGTTDPINITLAAYLAARDILNWVSLDAQSWRMSSEYSQYLNPYDLRPQYVGGDALINDSHKTSCRCPWCKYRPTFAEIKNMEYTDKTFFLSRHNYWVIENFAKDVFENSTDWGVLNNFLKRRFQKHDRVDSLIRGLCLFEALKSDDIHHIEKSFHNFLDKIPST